jgi:glutamate 5-kinase
MKKPAISTNLSTTPPRLMVVKLGTGVLTSGIGQLDTDRIANICAQISQLKANGTEVIIVSSGAVGLGMGRLGLTTRPNLLSENQACAAIGQSLLMQTWQHGFDAHHNTVAQVLLTHEDLRSRKRHLGVKASLTAILGFGAIPIINENDAVSGAEIKFGDNDTLSAMVASLAHAEYLVILSTISGLIDREGTGSIVPVVPRITPEIEAMAGGTLSATAVGGMISKISAAKLATKAGCGVFIAHGAEKDVLHQILSGHNPGTFFVANGLPLVSRKHWLTYFQNPKGQLHINANAATALQREGSSLLAVGVTSCRGAFPEREIVNIIGPKGEIVARGLCRFSALDVPRITGLNSKAISKLFPSRRRFEVVHRNDMVLM